MLLCSFKLCMVRGVIQRKKFIKALHQAREEVNLENRLEVLQLKFEEAERKRLHAEKITEEERKREHKMAALMNHHSMIIEEKELVELERKVLEQQQQDIVNESHEMIDYLRNEVSKQKELNAQLASEVESLKESNELMADLNASAGASLHMSNQQSKKLTENNANLISQASNLTCRLRSFEAAAQTTTSLSSTSLFSASPTSVLHFPELHDKNEEKKIYTAELKHQNAFDQIINLVKNGQEDKLVVNNISNTCNTVGSFREEERHEQEEKQLVHHTMSNDIRNSVEGAKDVESCDLHATTVTPLPKDENLKMSNAQSAHD